VRPLRSRVGRWVRSTLRWSVSTIGPRLASRRKLRPGVTVITANHNTLPYLKALVTGVRRHSPPGTPILIVDNGSTDGSRQWASSQPGVQLLRLPLNLGHGSALDAGVLLRCRTEFFVALDVDAFPIANDWIANLLDPLAAGAQVAGAHSVNPEVAQPYVHACCLAMRTSRFAAKGHTFAIGPTWDTAQRISQREWPNVHMIPVTSSHGPSILGSVFGGVIYHNFYAARFNVTSRTRIDGFEQSEADEAWRGAMARYFPDGAN
jgi:glycosyltransferase involved in cell wall biosynthesis